MSDLKQKFVISNNEIITGRVKFHRELDSAPVGGGKWFWDRERDTLYLYGTSFDFGRVTKEQVENAEPPILFENSKIIFEGDDPLIKLVDLLSRYMDKSRAIKLVSKNDFV